MANASGFDRFVYGCIMLFFGAFIGALAGSAGFFLSTPPRFNVAAFGLTAGLFFALGVALKDRSAEFLAGCLQSAWLLLNVAVENVSYEPDRKAFSPVLCLAFLIAWICALAYVLLRH